MANILIVDDRAISRQYLVTLLKYGNHHLLEAADGSEAYDLMLKSRPDLVISDIIMPKINGYELVEKMQNNSQLSAIPVIFYTSAYRVEEAALLATQHRVKYVLSKSSEAELILNTVNKALESITPSNVTPKDTIPHKSAISTDSKDETCLINKFADYFNNLDNIKNILDSMIDNTKSINNEYKRLVGMSQNFHASLSQLIGISNRLFSLVEFNLDLFSKEDIASMIDLLSSRMNKIMDTKHCMIGIMDNDKNSCKYFAIANDTNSKTSPSTLNYKFIEKIVSDRQQPIVIQDKVEIKKMGFPETCPVNKSILGLPIATFNKNYGFIFCIDKLDGGDFNKVDEELLTILSSLLALHYENSELNLELQI